MDDFGRILDQWESRKAAKMRNDPASEMESWLDQYPPEDKDALASADDSGEGGLPRRSVARHPEKVPADATLDLHGYRLNEALQATSDFIEQSASEGHRKVVIIHGKGDNGQGVLRREIRSFLEHHPLTGAMGYNRGPEGGRGALWVMLRNKTSGDGITARGR